MYHSDQPGRRLSSFQPKLHKVELTAVGCFSRRIGWNSTTLSCLLFLVLEEADCDYGWKQGKDLGGLPGCRERLNPESICLNGPHWRRFFPGQTDVRARVRGYSHVK